MEEIERSRRPEPRAKQEARAESEAGARAESNAGAIAEAYSQVSRAFRPSGSRARKAVTLSIRLTNGVRVGVWQIVALEDAGPGRCGCASQR